MKVADHLPELPAELMRAAYAVVPGNELDDGKFVSPECSALPLIEAGVPPEVLASYVLMHIMPIICRHRLVLFCA
jgi:hypothetical protein